MREKVKIEIRAEVRKNGRLIKSYPWKRANTLLSQFAQLLSVHLGQAPISITDTGGTPRSVIPYSISFDCNALLATTTFGIVIGTGNADVSMTNNKLGTQVTINVAHGASSISVENPDLATWRAVVSRAFTNNTGSLLSITEVGLYCRAFYTTVCYLCLERTLYSVSVPSGSAVTLTYRITISL